MGTDRTAVQGLGVTSPALRRLLVVGMGNPDRGDDAVGRLVARSLVGLLPPWAVVLESGGDVLRLLDDWAGYDWVILIDAAMAAVGPGTSPGTTLGRIHRLDGINDVLPTDITLASTHAMGVAEAIGLARALDCLPNTLTIYAVEANCFDSGSPMTPAVAAAVGPVTERIIAEVRENAGKEKSNA